MRHVIRTNLQWLLLKATGLPDIPPDTRKQRGAFPPNFVHSLDSTHMMLTALYCQRSGSTFASVHDSFWTHAANVGVMNRVSSTGFHVYWGHNKIKFYLAKHRGAYLCCVFWARNPSLWRCLLYYYTVEREILCKVLICKKWLILYWNSVDKGVLRLFISFLLAIANRLWCFLSLVSHTDLPWAVCRAPQRANTGRAAKTFPWELFRSKVSYLLMLNQKMPVKSDQLHEVLWVNYSL